MGNDAEAVVLGGPGSSSTQILPVNTQSNQNDLSQKILDAQKDIALLKQELAQLKADAANAQKKQEEIKSSIVSSDPTSFVEKQAEVLSLSAEAQKKELEAKEVESAIAAATEKSNTLRSDLIQAMKNQIAATVEQLKQEISTSTAQAEQKQAVVQQVEQKVAASPVASEVSSVISKTDAPVSSEALAAAGVSQETLRLKAELEKAQVDSKAALARADEAAKNSEIAKAKYNELVAEQEKTKLEIARAQEQKVVVEEQKKQLVVAVEVAQAAAKQAELQVAAVAPVVAPVITEISIPQGFTLGGAGLKHVSIGANNGAIEVWGVSPVGTLLRWNSQLPSGSRMQAFNAIDISGSPLLGFTSVALADDGTFMALSGGKVYRFNWASNQFAPETMPSNISFDRISVGSNQDIWAVNDAGQKIYQLTPSGWQEQFDGKSVSVAADGTVLALNARGVAFRRVMKAVTSDGTVTAAAGQPASKQGVRNTQTETQLKKNKAGKHSGSSVNKKQGKNKKRGSKKGSKGASSDKQNKNSKKGKKGKSARGSQGKQRRGKSSHGSQLNVAPSIAQNAVQGAPVQNAVTQNVLQVSAVIQAPVHEFTWKVLDPKERMRLSAITVINGGLVYGISLDGARFVQFVDGSDQWLPVQAIDGKPAVGLLSIAGNSVGVVVAVDGNGNMFYRGDLNAPAPKVAVAQFVSGSNQVVAQQGAVSAVQPQSVQQQNIVAGQVPAVAGVAQQSIVAGSQASATRSRGGRKSKAGKKTRSGKKAGQGKQGQSSHSGSKKAQVGKNQQVRNKSQSKKSGRATSAKSTAKKGKSVKKTKKGSSKKSNARK